MEAVEAFMATACAVGWECEMAADEESGKVARLVEPDGMPMLVSVDNRERAYLRVTALYEVPLGFPTVLEDVNAANGRLVDVKVAYYAEDNAVALIAETYLPTADPNAKGKLIASSIDRIHSALAQCIDDALLGDIV